MASPPLPLDSARWRTLKAHFGNAGQDGDLPSVPTSIRRWYAAVGTYAEEYEYADLLESYLHQRTLLDVAYAVVPHVVSRLRALDPDRAIEVVEDVAVVERVRMMSPDEREAQVAQLRDAFPERLRDLMVERTREGLAPLPADLAPAYLAAIDEVDAFAGPGWRARRPPSETPEPRHWRRHVRYLRETGWSDDDIRSGMRALRTVARGEMIAPVYRGTGDARAALGAIRNRIGELDFRALHTLAWTAAFEIETILSR
ncbi:MAG TPA: hypothetical protein VL463_05755 [Kofleriaceae bacterium]|nr:hypothetical protein [Kofleriaceae bacterium]